MLVVLKNKYCKSWQKQLCSLLDPAASWEELRARIRRTVLQRMTSKKELEREAFCMAAGGEHGCAMARDDKLQEEIRRILAEWLLEQHPDNPKMTDVAQGQPLRLIRGLLEAAGDPDRDFLLRAEQGLPLSPPSHPSGSP